MDKKEVDGMEGRLAEMSKRIEELKGRLTTAKGEVKTELEKRIDAAYADQQEQRQRLQQLKEKGLEHWDSFKDQAGKAWRNHCKTWRPGSKSNPGGTSRGLAGPE